MTGSFEDREVIVVGGSSGMDKSTAAGVVAGGGSAAIMGRDQARVDETVAELGVKRDMPVALPWRPALQDRRCVAASTCLDVVARVSSVGAGASSCQQDAVRLRHVQLST